MSSHVITQSEFLDIAATMFERYDNKDQSAHGLMETIGMSINGMATVSGLNNYDYQDLSTLSHGLKQLKQIQTLCKKPIPPEIMEHFKHIKCHCMMGLFPEIERAWLTIDSEIYIWNFEDPRDVAFYDGLNHLIISVGLVKPKRNVFVKNVQYLLVLTTPIEIIILGVTLSSNTKTISSPMRNTRRTTDFTELKVITKPVFVLSTDSVAMNVIEGSDDGRIFLGGRDGCLYEISYQAESDWFGKRCKKVNISQGIVSYMLPTFLKVFSEVDPIIRIAIDNNRKLLYFLTEKGSIELWDMGGSFYGLRRITKLTEDEISKTASRILSTVDKTVVKEIKSICPLNSADCKTIHFLAVTHCGVRLYFATTPLFDQPKKGAQKQRKLSMQQQQCVNASSIGVAGHSLHHSTATSDCEKPSGLYLMHIRVPPGYTSNTTVSKPKQVHTAHYNDGTLLLVCTPQQDHDILWSISSAPFPNRPYLAESITVLPMDGVVWSMAEIKDQSNMGEYSIFENSEKQKRIILLTNQGIHIVALLKPTDILQQVLAACNGPLHEAVKCFFKVQSEHEACATCVSLACSKQYRGSEVAVWAAQAFLVYGGEPTFQHQIVINAPGTDPNARYSFPITGIDRNSPHMFMSTPMASSGSPVSRTMQHASVQSPLQQMQYPLSPIGIPNPYGSAISSRNEVCNIVYSAKHDGLYLYVARLLRPIWKRLCLDSKKGSAMTDEECALKLDYLHAIKDFLEANQMNELSYSSRPYASQSTMSNGFTHILSDNTTLNSASDQRNAAEQAIIEEKRSITALNYFIKHMCEVLGLWKILCQHQFNLLINQLTKDQQDILASCTFRDLTLSRSDTCAVLIVALINCYLKDNASVSSISAKLREVCPSLYRHEDAVSFKATEMLVTSKNCTSIEEKKLKLRTALQLCKDAAPNLPLQNICQQFILAGFFEGVIDLTSTCAAKVDPEEIGIHFYKKNEPQEDREGFAAYAARVACYKGIHHMIDHIYQGFWNASANIDSLQETAQNNDILSGRAQIMQIVLMAVQIKDPLLHITIYEWLMLHDMLADLLSFNEPTLGEFLRRSVVRNPDNVKLIDILWKYYERNGKHSQAARILDNLVSTQTRKVTLDQRIEYLAKAVMCMRNDSVGSSIANGILLKDLEEKLEIARVQKEVLIAVIATRPNAAKAIDDLNYSLYDVTALYQNFADPFDLWECKLIILNCSNHNDPLLVESIWREIINETVNSGGSMTEKATRLFTKIENLVRQFGESGHCFPLAFLIRELEVKACQLKMPVGIVPENLVSIDLDIDLLMEYYSRMISMNERVWANEGNEWHLVESSIQIVSILANRAHSMWYSSRRRIVGKAQDIVSTCLNLCYQKPGTERLQEQLKDLQCRLQRSIDYKN